MMIGTDTSTLSIALPRDETPRIIRLEQNLNILKLGRDNLSDRLAVFEREAEEIKQDLDSVQMNNTNLHQIADTIGQGIPDVSEILHDYRAGRKEQNYSSSFNKNQLDLPYSSSGIKNLDVPYGSTGMKNLDAPYGSTGMKNQDAPYGSSGIKNLDAPYGNFGTIKESLREQNRESSMPNENEEKFDIDEKNLEENNPSVGLNEVEEGEKFPNGILKDIIKARGMVMERVIFIQDVTMLKKLWS